jgi:hypothetical protein
MHNLVALAVFILLALWLWSKRSSIRATDRHNANNTWANAADTRFARYPRRRPFTKKRGLK